MNTLAAVDLGTGIEQAFADVAEFVPKFVAFVFILVVGALVAKALAKAADSVLERVGFDGAVERGGVRRALASSKYDASTIASKIVYYALMLFVLQLAFGVWGDNPVSDLIHGVIAYLPKVFAAIVIVVVASAIAAAVKDIVATTLSGLSYGSTLANLAAGSILVIAAFMALGQLQIAPAIVTGLFYALLAIVAGSAIVAIGGGGVKPMQRKWEQALERMEQEYPRVKEQAERRKPMVDLAGDERVGARSLREEQSRDADDTTTIGRRSLRGY